MVEDITNEVIFRYFYENLSLKAGSFVINSQFYSNAAALTTQITNIRVVSVDQSNLKSIIIEQDVSGQQLHAGDEIVITAPQNSYILKTRVVSVTVISGISFTVILEDSFAYTGGFIKNTYLDKDHDFRPIVQRTQR